jgi:Dyp-type peroxidase family
VDEFDTVQGNVLDGYAHAHCARLLLFRISSPEQARATIRRLSERVTTHAAVRAALGRDEVRFNIGFTYRGLRSLQLHGSELSGIEQELPFRESMQRRKHDLGDTRDAIDRDAHWGEQPLDLVLLLHLDEQRSAALLPLLEREGALARFPKTAWHTHAGRALRSALGEQLDAATAELGTFDGLAQTCAIDLHHPLVEGHGIEYFGFRDGISNPHPLVDGSACDFVLQRPGDALLDGGTFMVMRQLEQHIERFWSEVSRNAQSLGMSATELAERLMGRRQSGAAIDDAAPVAGRPAAALAAGGHGDALERAHASKCPFASHVRRFNPQVDAASGGNPRIIRRGLSYLDDRGRRGLMFLAINADIAAQFEFMQKNWVQRGNSAGGMSRDYDVIAGTALEAGHTTRFDFAPDPEPNALTFSPFVSLVEGEYVFMPSLEGLALIGADPSPSGRRAYEGRTPDPIAALLARGTTTLSRDERERIQAWLDHPAWSRRFWEAVQERGQDRGDKGVRVGEYLFVADADEVRTILRNEAGSYSTSEYARRMAPATGEFFLAMDEHTARYRRERATAAFLAEIPAAEVARSAAQIAERLFDDAKRAKLLSDDPDGPVVVAVRELLAVVLDGISTQYFGLPGPSPRSLASWGRDLAWYFFRLFPNESDRAKAILAGQQYRGHVSSLCTESEAEQDRARHERLRTIRERIGDALARPGSDEPSAGRDDVARNLLGIVTGSLGATMKLFLEGLGAHLAQHSSGKIAFPERPGSLYESIIQSALARARRGGPDSLYRVRSDGTKVVVWLGGAQTIDADILFGAGAHACPGSDIAKGMMEGMLEALRRRDCLFKGQGEELRFELS